MEDYQGQGHVSMRISASTRACSRDAPTPRPSSALSACSFAPASCICCSLSHCQGCPHGTLRAPALGCCESEANCGGNRLASVCLAAGQHFQGCPCYQGRNLGVPFSTIVHRFCINKSKKKSMQNKWMNDNDYKWVAEFILGLTYYKI